MDRAWTLPVAISILIALVSVAWNGRIIYGMDDAYIHMAVARNCAEKDVWSINSDGFETATSSLIYPAVLCGLYKMAGIHDIIPLLVNLLALAGIAVYVRKTFGMGVKAMLGFYFFSFLPFLVVTGMEHTLHVLLAVVFTAELIKTKWNPVLLWSSAVLLPLVRFESLALLAAGLVYSSLTGKLRKTGPILGGFLAAFSASVALYIATGHPLPLSMIAKSPYTITSNLSIFKLLFRFPYTLMTSAWFFSQYVLSLVNLRSGQGFASKSLAFVYLIAGALHAQFGVMDMRYFSYLQAIFILQFYKFDFKSSLARAKLLGLVFITPLLLMSSLGLFRAVTAPHDIYIQQYQMAQFIRENYGEDTVMLNDIGTTSYYTGARVIDLVGLANEDVMTARKKGEFGAEFVGSLAERENVSVALLYSDWFPGQIPTRFTKSGDLNFHFKVISGKSRISVYAVGENFQSLRENLAGYGWPDEVSIETA